MATEQNLKEQRDRFLAFSFASSDLFLEVDESGEVVYALGASKSLTGVDHSTLTGHSWLDIFSRSDRATLVALHKQAREGERLGPIQVTMDKELCGGKEAILTAIKMPDSQSFYLTIGFVSEIMMKLASIIKQSKETTLLDKDAFLYTAQEALNIARTMGQEIDMTLLDIIGIQEAKDRLGNDVWDQFTDAITEFLSSNSLDGKTIAEITEGRFSIIHDKAIDSEMLCEQITEISKETDPDGKGLEIVSKSITADLGQLSERETTKALIYTINEFERRGTDLTIETLNTGFKAYVSANAQKIQQFKTMIERLSFDFVFQPIIDLQKQDVSHFEMLSKFHEEGSTQEWVVFAEDIGMATSFDNAVCERAVNYLLYQASNNSLKFSVNLSGQSIQNDQFFNGLRSLLKPHKHLASRLSFEITESYAIEDFERANKIILALRKDGYKVCLDDFGAGASSYQYMQNLSVDYLKIDGLLTRRMMETDKDMVLLKNIVQTCKDLKIQVIAEKIELESQEAAIRELGIEMGQGYLFSHPAETPSYERKK